MYSLNTKVTRQTVIGFGGAFTDAAGINIASLPSDAQDQLINAYYGDHGNYHFSVLSVGLILQMQQNSLYLSHFPRSLLNMETFQSWLR